MEPDSATTARPPDAGSGAGAAPRVTFVTDIVTPYMVTQFDALATQSRLHVIFCAQTGSRAMPWDLADRLSFSHEVIGGLSLPGHRGDGTDYHLSPRILRAIARSRPDAVIASGYSTPTAYASLYCTAFRRPLVIHSVGTARSEREFGTAQGLARKLFLRTAATCAAASAASAERFQELGVAPEKIFLTTHTTDLEAHWAVGRERSYEPGDALRLVAVGRLIPRKGFDRLLRAVATARDSGAAIKLRFVGTGPGEDGLRRLADELGIAGAVSFAGFVDQAELPGVYAEADAFAFPTLRDPFGFVLLEAAATGLPVVASPEAGATQELIDDDRTGLVAHPDDVDATARALARLAGDPALRERLGRAAHQVTLRRTPELSARGFMEAVEAGRRDPSRALA
jgi:glycosyltransferase involved in cell wall biosynthesis